MASKHLTYFKVENFKRFDSLEVEDIGQFNLIVGDNNVGKTTLLEALLFDEENDEKTLINLFFGLENREIYVEDNKINFLDFYFQREKQTINYAFQFYGDPRRNELTLTKRTRFDLSSDELHDNAVPLTLSSSPYLLQFVYNEFPALKIVRPYDENDDIEYEFPFLGMKIFYDEEIFDFSTIVSNSNKKLQNFKNVLQSFIPNITSIEISNSIISGHSMIIIRESGIDMPKPLAEYGDGFIKFFRCLLKIELCEDKRLMIDEIEAGIHYSRMKDFLKKVLQSAKNKNVQIFATTHSKECLQYYTEALQELGYENDGRVIKIASTKRGIKAYSSRFGQFENSLSAESEIR